MSGYSHRMHTNLQTGCMAEGLDSK